MTNDQVEQNDLAREHPDKVKALYRKLLEWEMGLERPLFMLTRAAEKWSAERTAQFRKPPAADY